MSETTLFDPFPQRIKAFSALVESIAEARLKAAQAELAEAIAAGHWARARVLETVLTQLQADFEAVNRARITARRKVHDLAAKAHAASMLLQGTEIAAFAHARDAYKFFERQALIEGDASLFSAAIDPNALDGAMFLDNRKPDRPCAKPPSDGAGAPINALQLMDWALRQNYIARAGTAAQAHFAHLFRQIAQVARASIAAIEKARDAFESKAFDVWKPVRILGVEPTPAESRILNTTGPNPAS